jgi:hypothetical protein
MSSKSFSVGPRQKRRKVEKVMANIQLVHEANLAVAECNDDANTWTVPHEDETSTKSTNVSMLFDGDS